MTTTSIMARPTTGAGRDPRNQEPAMPDYRTFERILTAVTDGRISRSPDTYEYVDTANRLHDLDLLIFEMEDRGWLRLDLDGTVEVTAAGQAWQSRPRKRGPVPAAKFSDQPGAAA